MNNSTNILDNLPYEMGALAKSVELITLPIFTGFVVGFYRGIEINHPGA